MQYFFRSISLYGTFSAGDGYTFEVTPLEPKIEFIPVKSNQAIIDFTEPREIDDTPIDFDSMMEPDNYLEYENE